MISHYTLHTPYDSSYHMHILPYASAPSVVHTMLAIASMRAFLVDNDWVERDGIFSLLSERPRYDVVRLVHVIAGGGSKAHPGPAIAKVYQRIKIHRHCEHRRVQIIQKHRQGAHTCRPVRLTSLKPIRIFQKLVHVG